MSLNVDTQSPYGTRAQFIRDAEAATRLGDPKAARTFLIKLCRRRAWVELYDEVKTHRMTLAEAEYTHKSRTRQLLELCHSLGYCSIEVTHTEILVSCNPWYSE